MHGEESVTYGTSNYAENTVRDRRLRLMIKDMIKEYNDSADKILARLEKLRAELSVTRSFEQAFQLSRRILNLEAIAAETRRTAWELAEYERAVEERKSKTGI